MQQHDTSVNPRSRVLKDEHVKGGGRRSMSYHAAEVGDGGVLVGVGVEQHLCVGVDGYVRLDVLPALA